MVGFGTGSGQFDRNRIRKIWSDQDPAKRFGSEWIRIWPSYLILTILEDSLISGLPTWYRYWRSWKTLSFCFCPTWYWRSWKTLSFCRCPTWYWRSWKTLSFCCCPTWYWRSWKTLSFCRCPTWYWRSWKTLSSVAFCSSVVSFIWTYKRWLEFYLQN